MFCLLLQTRPNRVCGWLLYAGRYLLANQASLPHQQVQSLRFFTTQKFGEIIANCNNTRVCPGLQLHRLRPAGLEGSDNVSGHPGASRLTKVELAGFLTNRLGGDIPLWEWLTITQVLSECLLITAAGLPFRRYFT